MERQSKLREKRKFVIEKIKQALEMDYKVVVVVSAPGRNPDPYATDTLIQMVDEPKNRNERRELDLLMACGEIISSTVLADELRRSNVSAVALTGAQAGLITTDDFNEAKIKKVKPDRIKRELVENDVVVVAGSKAERKTAKSRRSAVAAATRRRQRSALR